MVSRRKRTRFGRTNLFSIFSIAT